MVLYLDSGTTSLMKVALSLTNLAVYMTLSHSHSDTSINRSARGMAKLRTVNSNQKYRLWLKMIMPIHLLLFEHELCLLHWLRPLIWLTVISTFRPI